MYLPTIGLEVHAELKTRTKMFCDSANNPDETRPNTNVCPVCLAHPGTLPVVNREAVRHILRIGTAVGGTLADYSEFDRKSYFYPDIPKGYQISQYAYPLVTGGLLAGVALTRVHLEEDTARSIHIGRAEGPDGGAEGKSLVDFNRAGIPLMELVTEPVIADAETAGRFARELQLLLRTLGASNANLEKGEMRIEANVSVARGTRPDRKSESSRSDRVPLGTKVEIKNLNSFRSVERAIAYEIKRQTKLIESGVDVVQETRGWDEAKQVTFHQRFKEGSADYRYFPEPDLPRLFLSEIPEFAPEVLRASLPELPWARRARYARAYALKEIDITYLSATLERAEFFDAVTAVLEHDAKAIALATNYIVSDLAGIYANPVKDETSHGARQGERYSELDPMMFAKLIRLVEAHRLSSRGAKDTLLLMAEGGGDPEAIAQEHNLIQVHDTAALGAIVDAIIKREGNAVEEYKRGKQASLQYLVGQAMRESRGAGNPLEIQRLLLEKITQQQ